MNLRRFSITNYKSYAAATDLTFGPGFNILVGENNAGKSALLEAMALRFSHQPNISIRSRPERGTPLNPESRAEFDVEFSRVELLSILRNEVGVFSIPLRGPGQPADFTLREFNETLNGPPILRAVYVPGTGFNARLDPGGISSANYGFLNARVLPGQDQVTATDAGSTGDVGKRLASVFVDRIITLQAERFNVGETGFGSNAILDPHARNLPEVLNALQSNAHRFQRFNDLVSAVFPHIRRITVIPISGSGFRIMVWSVDPSTERDDLAMPLSASGTGIGQVLAILYVFVTPELPRLFLIDEPQSFLHPGAFRTLLEILRANSDHQFIVTTHSPIPLTATVPSTIAILSSDDNQTRVQSVDPAQASIGRQVLVSVGARLSDVFGYDAILWVEGRTEEVCFPEILRTVARRTIHGVGIIGILNTGDLDRRDSAQVVEIYRRLSEGGSLVPPAVAFLIDRERRPLDVLADLQAAAGNRLHFLPRRMYENYLVHPLALASVLGAVEGAFPDGLSAGTIEDWTAANGATFLPNDRRELMPMQTKWLESVDAARLLAALVSSLSETRLQYDKVRHGEALTKWLAANDPSALQELGAILLAILEGPGLVSAGTR